MTHDVAISREREKKSIYVRERKREIRRGRRLSSAAAEDRSRFSSRFLPLLLPPRLREFLASPLDETTSPSRDSVPRLSGRL